MPFLEKKPIPDAARAELSAWSSDLLLHLVLVLQQEMAPACAELPLDALTTELQMAYLKHLGLEVPPAERDLAFRAFLATREDHPAIAAKLKASKAKTAIGLAKAVYGTAEVYRGAMLVSSKPVSHKILDSVLKTLCPVDACAFWDKRAIYKVLVTEHGGLAAYVPETASLVLSRSLVEVNNPLHRLVIIHELAHAAARKAAIIEEAAWVPEFAAFSGWGLPDLKPEQLAASRGDILSKLSKGSPFTLLPDPVIGALDSEGKKFEGFPLGRTYARVSASGDTSEDFADAVAAYLVAPERFCFRKKPIAAGKYRWISRIIFGREKTLRCGKGAKR